MSDIVFEPFAPDEDVGTILGVIRLAGLLRDVDETAVIGYLPPLAGTFPPGIGGVYGLVPRLRGVSGLFGGNGDGALIGAIEAPEGYLSGAVVTVDATFINGITAGIGGELVGALRMTGSIEGQIDLRGLLSSFGGPMVVGQFAIAGDSYARIDFAAGISILQRPGILYLVGNGLRARLAELFGVGGSPLEQIIHGLIAHLDVTATPLTALQAFEALRGGLGVADSLGVVWRLLLGSTLGIAGSVTPSTELIARVIDSLHVLAGPGSLLTCRNLVTEALAVADALAIVAKEQLTDEAAFHAVLADALTARERMVSEILATALVGASARILAAVDETLAIDGALDSSLSALNRVVASLGFSLTIRIGDTVYAAWVVNPETRGAWRYENWPFNSMCEFEGQYFGASDDGIYVLEGDDDAGDDIAARFRIGLSNLGTGREKRIPSLYVAYTADDRLILKAITAEIDGTLTENWYELVPRGGGERREGRWKLGRGLAAVFWDFEVANVNGADFAIHDMDFYPLTLDRRVKGRDQE